MSHYDYARSIQIAIAIQNEPFAALIMAAMRQADTRNAERLMHAFPEIWDELWERVEAPDGVLPGEPAYRRPYREEEQ